MTQLELVEHDLNKGRGITREVVAVSSSHTALREHCVEKYGVEVGIDNLGDRQTYYTIHESPIVIVPAKF